MVHDPHRTGARPSGQARTPESEAQPEAGGDRVAKMLARAGVASRREATPARASILATRSPLSCEGSLLGVRA
ncbi:MAG: hypothetical protein ACXWKR_02610, partial [Phenylobacterium sp.]